MSISLTTSKPSRIVLCAYRRANMRGAPGTTIRIEVSTSTGTTDGCLPQSLYFCPGERLCCCWMVVVYESNAKIFISTRALHSTTCSPTATWSSIHEKHHCLLARTFEPVYHPLDIGVRSIGDLSRSGQLHWRQQAQAYYLIEDARLQITSSSQIQRYQLSLWDAVYERSLKADLCGAYGSVSWRPSVIQQIHEIVEVAAEALLRYDTGVLAEN